MSLLLHAGLAAVGLHAIATFKEAWNVIPAPATSATAPQPFTPARRARRVLLAVVDGLRVDAARELPFLRELGARGVEAVAVTEYPPVSLPNYASIVTGAPPRVTGILNNHHLGPFPHDSIVRRARAAGLRTALVGPPASGLERLDGPFYDTIDELLQEPSLPRGALVLYLTIDADVAGHAFGATSPEYAAAAIRADRQLRRLVGALDLARDAVVVTADHGRVDFGGHGGLEPVELEVPLVLAGSGVRPGAAPVAARVTDVAPTVAALLGLPSPGDATGRVLTELLLLGPGEATSASVADARRRDAIERRVEDWRVVHDAEGLGVRRARLATLVVALLAAVPILRALRRAALLDPSAVAAGIAVPVAVALLALSSHQFRLSPSYGPRRATMTQDAAFYAVLLALLTIAALLVAPYRGGSMARLAWRAGAAQVELLVGLALLGTTHALLWPPFDAGLPTPAQVALLPMTSATVVCASAVQCATLLGEGLLMAIRRPWRGR